MEQADLLLLLTQMVLDQAEEQVEELVWEVEMEV